MKTVLVTAIGTVTATSIVKELKKTDGYYIIGTDINARNEVAASRDTDEFYVFPPASDENYLPFAAEFCRQHRVDYYFAVIDTEVAKIASAKAQFDRIGTKLCVPDAALVDICHYKDRFSRWISRHFTEIEIKTYMSADRIPPSAYPIFMKPVEGVASKGCRMIRSYEQMKAAFPDSLPEKAIFQEYVVGKNITVDCIRNRKTGQQCQIQRLEKIRNANGCGIAVEIIHSERLEEICSRLMEALDLNGVVNMEFFDTGAGYKIIEINPRFSAGTAFSCMAGVNTVQNAMLIADGKECVFGTPEIGAHFAEKYEAYRMD